MPPSRTPPASFTPATARRQGPGGRSTRRAKSAKRERRSWTSINAAHRYPYYRKVLQGRLGQSGQLGQKEPPGPRGLRGPQGPAGTPGITDAYIANNGNDDFNPPGVNSDGQFHQIISLSVPAGVYAVTAKGLWRDFDHDAIGRCQLEAAGSTIDETFPDSETDGVQVWPVTLIGTASLPSGGILRVACRTLADGVEAPNFKIVALKVGAIHQHL